MGAVHNYTLARFIDNPIDLIVKPSHVPGIQLGYLSTLFEWVLAGLLCTLTSGKWSQWGSVATAQAATGDFLPVTQQRNLSPLQFQLNKITACY